VELGKVRMSHIAVNWVRYGLLLWIAGTFDLMDEIFHQPRWMGYYCEDLLRLSGMLLTVVGSTKLLSASICCTSTRARNR
jgi:hypothetical protein